MILSILLRIIPRNGALPWYFPYIYNYDDILVAGLCL
jgi:hypothetical protein